MTTIMISIIPDGIPVDKMQGGEDDSSRCPIATQDQEVNDVNKMYAESEGNYRESVSEEACGVCSSYNQTSETLECIGDDSGELGYCQVYKFVCATEYVCDSWSQGGPITNESQEDYKDIL